MRSARRQASSRDFCHCLTLFYLHVPYTLTWCVRLALPWQIHISAVMNNQEMTSLQCLQVLEVGLRCW